MANNNRDDATTFALNACKRATSAEAMMRSTIQCACSARSKARAVGNCWWLLRLCQGATYETAEMTTQKKTRPAKIVSRIASEKSLAGNPGRASSAHLPTDSK